MHVCFIFVFVQKELVLYPNKNGCVADLLEEGKKQVDLIESGSAKLRCQKSTQKLIINLLIDKDF